MKRIKMQRKLSCKILCREKNRKKYYGSKNTENYGLEREIGILASFINQQSRIDSKIEPPT